jgi:hypothetical protein
MFAKAAHPERVFAGVVWQYKLPAPGREDEEKQEVDRLHPELNMLTRAVELEAAKVGLYKLRIQLIHSLKPPGFNP